MSAFTFTPAGTLLKKIINKKRTSRQRKLTGASSNGQMKRRKCRSSKLLAALFETTSVQIWEEIFHLKTSLPNQWFFYTNVYFSSPSNRFTIRFSEFNTKNFEINCASVKSLYFSRYRFHSFILFMTINWLTISYLFCHELIDMHCY